MTDSMAVLVSLQSLETNNWHFNRSHDQVIQFTTGGNNNLIYVGSSTRGNSRYEEADEIAKELLKMKEPNRNISLSRSEGKHFILEACNKKRQTVWDSCHTGRHYYKVQRTIKKGKIIHNLSRREQVIFTHLRTGHSNLTHTLHIIGKHNSGLCDVCLIETVEHVLKKSKAYIKKRRILN